MRKFSPFVIIHLILMFGLVLCASFSTVLFLGRFDFAVAGKDNAQIMAAGCTMFVILLMLLSGILYLFNEYSKRAAIFYKVFLCLIMVVTAAVIFIDNTIGTINALLISKAVLGVIKILVLLLLAFWKDLGKKRTYILFVLLLLLDIGIGGLLILNMLNKGFDFSFVGVVTALIVDVTVGLAIHGKYADKAERGSK